MPLVLVLRSGKKADQNHVRHFEPFLTRFIIGLSTFWLEQEWTQNRLQAFKGPELEESFLTELERL